MPYRTGNVTCSPLCYLVPTQAEPNARYGLTRSTQQIDDPVQGLIGLEAYNGQYIGFNYSEMDKEDNGLGMWFWGVDQDSIEVIDPPS